MIVARGKFSEGFNFKYNLCRALFIIGVPNLDIKSAKVQLKKIFYEKIDKLKELGAIPINENFNTYYFR